MMKQKVSTFFAAFFAVSSLGLSSANAAAIPACLNHGAPLAVNDDQVEQWKTTTANQFLARAHVTGTVTRVFPDEHGHNHFEVTMGPGAQNTVEVIYNISFGKLPEVQEGMSVEACGDFINSFAQAGSYPASPDGAILHWVHRNPKSKGHDSGFVALNGVLYGQGNGYGD